MKFVHVIVEGYTEYDFVRDVLNPYLNPKGLHLTQILLTTKRIKGGVNSKGGVTSYYKARNDILNKLNDKSVMLVTTMIDFYGLPTDFPKYRELPSGSCYQRAEFLEQALSEDIAHENFLPYLMLHEFEAMLFTSPQAIVATLLQPDKLPAVTKIKNDFSSPEEINTEQPPSKRLIDLFPEYDKRLMSPAIANEIGINEIRQTCPHFNGWLTKLETLIS